MANKNNDNPPVTGEALEENDVTIDTRAMVEYLSQKRSPEEIEEAIRQLRKNETVGAVSLLAKESRLDREEAISFVCQGVRPLTAKRYRYDLIQFFGWVDGPGPGAVLGVKSEHAAKYVSYLNNKYTSPNTVRSKTAPIRLLYNYLIDGSYSISNPFRGVRIPRAQYRNITRQKKGLDAILSNEKIAEICDVAANQKNPVGRSVLLMIYYGLRLGAMRDVRIVGKKAVVATTKGGQVIRLTPKDVGGDNGLLEMLPERPTAKMPYYGLRKAVSRFLAEYKCTPHDLRHAFAVTQYKRPKMDVYAVSRILGHNSIQTTQNYLASLGALKEKAK